MCGIVLFAGPRAAERLEDGLARVRHRGPDDLGTWIDGHIALGFARLEINGPGEAGRQPLRVADRVGVVNGEIYNYRALMEEHQLDPSSCDARVLLPLLDRFGDRVIDHLDGFYAAVVLQRGARTALCLRDHMGKKPLFVGRSGTEVFIVSELKVLDEIDSFRSLPKGFSEVDLETGDVWSISSHRPVRAEAELRVLFEAAVGKRLPAANQPVGVFLSGGLDSSLVAAFVSRRRPDAVYFTLGDPEGPDRRWVDELAGVLGLVDVRPVGLPAEAELPQLIREVVRATESWNPSIVSNGLATFLLARSAHTAGIKVVLTGEGADELFGGYHQFLEGDPWRAVRRHLLDDMETTELRRLDLSCMAHSVEPRCPFLDRAVRVLSDRLGYHEMYSVDENKVELRRAFAGVLPHRILHRRKTSFDVGSGVRGRVVEYLRRNGRTEREELRDLWRELFRFDSGADYFHAYPVFDEAIDRRRETHR